jgi:hypothetical protein
MALGAADREAEPDRSRGVDPVDDGPDPILLLIDASLAVGQGVAVEAGARPRTEVCARHQVAGKLLEGELVEREVAVQGVDHPVAIAPGVGKGRILLVAVAVGVARQVEPVPPPALAVMRRTENPLDQPLIGAGLGIVDKGVDLGRGWR